MSNVLDWLSRFNSSPTVARPLHGDLTTEDRQLLVELGRQLYTTAAPVENPGNVRDDAWYEYAGLKAVSTVLKLGDPSSGLTVGANQMYVVFWDEREHGQTRPDGCTLHRSAKDARRYILQAQAKWLSDARSGETYKRVVRRGPLLVTVSPQLARWCDENFKDNTSFLGVGVNETHELTQVDPYSVGWYNTKEQ